MLHVLSFGGCRLGVWVFDVSFRFWLFRLIVSRIGRIVLVLKVDVPCFGGDPRLGGLLFHAKTAKIGSNARSIWVAYRGLFVLDLHPLLRSYLARFPLRSILGLSPPWAGLGESVDLRPRI